MKAFFFIKALFFSVLLSSNVLHSQTSAASCVHAGGLSFYLDAFLGSLGACDCQRSGVFLSSVAKCNNDPYVIAFEDNFDGDTIDLSKWQLSPSAQSNLEGGQSVELRTLNNVSVKNGTCSIIAKKETVIGKAVNYRPDNEILSDGKPNLRTYNYTSSLLVSRNSFYHGKYEIRCKMPKGNGLWPAFWTFGGDRYNEIDIFDTYKGTEKIVSTIYHDYDGDSKPSGCSDTYDGFDLTEWHTYSCVWETDQITFFIDDKPLDILYRLITAAKEPVLCSDNIANGTYYQLISYPLEPMKIIFNLALTSKSGPGSSMPVDETTPFPSSFDVDYIRFWKREPGSITAFPNPASEFINVTSKTDILSISICNLDGKILFSEPVNSISTKINLSQLTDGLYLLTAKLEGTVKRIKFVKLTR